MSAAQSCYHCGSPVPPHTHYQVEIEGESRPMCCPGCEAVAFAIVNGGLDSYYRYRTELATKPEELSSADLDPAAELALYDRDDVQHEFVDQLEQGLRQASLVIEGITCAACVWLIEHQLNQLPGIDKVSINLSNHRAQLRWRQDQIALSRILQAIRAIGYQAYPYQPDQQQRILQQEERRATRRLAVAGIGMMQVMMYAIALYAGAFEGMAEDHHRLLRWVSLLIATPVVLYAARPFFQAAWRDLKTRHLSMDVPVSLAIGGAYLASVWATLHNTGEVYFDSVSMFTFFLLFGRYLEMRARHRTGRSGNALNNLIPSSAIRIRGDQQEVIPARDLQPGDIALIKPGHTVPADGTVMQGVSSLDESALTGEYMPLTKQAGDRVWAGTINVESPLRIQVERTGKDARVANIVRLLDRAHEDKPQVAKLADKVAQYFVAAVLLVSTLVALVWWQLEPENAFWITLSVLVVTCPCALSLATPTALTAATGALKDTGLLVTRSHVLEGLAGSDHIIFDKTGTLTEGNLTLRQTVLCTSELDTQQALAIACALESHSEHPIAKAFSQTSSPALSAAEVRAYPAQGLEGQVAGQRYRIGKPAFALPQDEPPVPPEHGQWLLLSDLERPLAWFRLSDNLRPQAADCVSQLQAMGFEVELLSGDHPSAVNEIAEQLGIATATGGATPEDKLQRIHTLQQQGKQVIMVGDGINDVPVLAGAQVSIAMGSASDLAKTSADAILLSGRLDRIVDALQLARQTRRIIRQNLTWALGYNATALPLAACGLIPPYLAAIGMSASSLIVVANALRLNRTKQPAPPEPYEPEPVSNH